MKTTTLLALAAGALVMFGTACGADDKDGDGGGFEIAQGALAGQIAGMPFETKSGFARDVFNDGEYWIELHDAEVEDPCAMSFPDGPHIILRSDGQPMDAALSLQNNITFTYGEAQNDIATTGRLVIDGIDGDMLSGGLYAKMDASEVDGTFSVPVCASN